MDQELIQTFKKHYSHGDPSHDWLHIERVVRTCKELANELGANLKTLLPAAYLHDVINIPKDSELRSKAAGLAANKASELLKDSDLTDEEIQEITTIILEHSYSANLKPSSLESQILQDADKLDGMGAIGVMRWTTCGAKMKSTYYHANDPWGEDRELDDKSYSLDHFEKKLLNLYGRLNTAPAKIEGEKRMAFFESFLSQLKSEI
ncbi:MAG: HD domain-containing protein [Bacteriovoracaceae bacterium]|nr:HD domain-containing protein [Bacteriovoracaceae bacterium]